MAKINFEEFGDVTQAAVDRAELPLYGFTPSPMQLDFFHWIHGKNGSAVLQAVAGSGKSTTIVRCLPYISRSASVTILAFNKIIADEMKEKIQKLGKELGVNFDRVDAKTFHSLGFGAVRKRLNNNVKLDGNKLISLFRDLVNRGDNRFVVETNESKRLPEDNEAREYLTPDQTIEMYGSFVARLVSLGKGIGVGCLAKDVRATWQGLVDHHDLSLDSQEADDQEAILLAHYLLEASNEAAEDGLIDFDDQIYLPILWRLKLWQNDFLFVDEAQDTNPVRRALCKLALRPGGRLIAVGDSHQAIYGFTGASHDAIDQIKEQFNAIELPLTVSYRCPKAAEALVNHLVPHFSVHESAVEGSVSHVSVKAGLAKLTAEDAILCRNTAPLVELAFQIIASGRGCMVLGKDIGQGLINLINKQKAKGLLALTAKLEAFRDREVSKFMAKGEEQKAEAITDRVACVLTVMDHLHENERTIPALVAKIQGMFSDDQGGKKLLTLSTAHKAKGREWEQVAVLQPELMPSKWARQAHQMQQELNLQYVTWTRFKLNLFFLDGVDEQPANENKEAV
jgi:DNA helicase-2/ATP-dependent DNA helicase PcrA